MCAEHFCYICPAFLRQSIPNFLRNRRIDFHSAVHFHTPTSNGWMSPDCAFSPAWAVIHVIDLSHSDRCNTKSESSFDLHFPKGKGSEHFFKSFSAFWVSYIGNFVCIWTPVLIGLFGFLISSLLSSVYILDVNPQSDVELVKKNLFLFGRLLFVWNTVSLALQMLFIFMSSHLLIVDLNACAVSI